MKRISNQGFLLMETLIVAVFVTTLTMFIYQNSLPLMGEYERRINYDDIDSVYAVNLVRKVLLHDDNIEALTEGILEGDTVIRDITDCSLWKQTTLCDEIKRQTGIVPSTLGASNDGKIYITRYELSKLKDEIKDNRLFERSNDRGIRTYINYLPRFTTTSVTQGYRLIITRNVLTDTSEIQKFANIEVVL